MLSQASSAWKQQKEAEQKYIVHTLLLQVVRVPLIQRSEVDQLQRYSIGHSLLIGPVLYLYLLPRDISLQLMTDLQ